MGVRYGGDGPTRGTLTVDVHRVSPNELPSPTNGTASDRVHSGGLRSSADENVRSSADDQGWEMICNELNSFIVSISSGYPWFIRRPTFFVQDDPSQARDDSGNSTRCFKRLRANVEYGLQVTDEWMMIHIMLTFTGRNPDLLLAVECWDDDDGQILLIEAAQALPDWVDSVDCRHRCWIQAGKVKLLSPESAPVATVESALSYLYSLSLLPRSDAEQEANVRVTEEVQSAIRTRVTSVSHTHCASVYLPRSVVETLMKSHSHLVGEVVAAFVEQASSRPSAGPLPHQGAISAQDMSRFPSVFRSNDWIWTSFVFGRTHYAILRQFCSSSWPACDDVPSWFVSSLSEQQAERDQQTMPSFLSTLHGIGTYPSHVKSGICVGVRLLVGLLQCLRSASTETEMNEAMPQHQAKHEWKRLNVDMEFWCDARNDPDDSGAAEPPLHPLDDEDWMNVTEEEMKRLTTIADAPEPAPFKKANHQDAASDVESILGGVRGFLNRKSDVFGVETKASERETAKVLVDESPPALQTTFEIDPVVVMNLLHDSLKAPTANELALPVRPKEVKASAADPFFSEQDYHDLVGEGSTGSDDGDSSTTSSISESEEYDPAGVHEDAEMRNLMNAMDLELRRAMDVTDEDVRNVDDPETVESMHLLSNLLQSLESSSGPGAMGPLQSMLTEMGIDTPDAWSPTK
jgi:SGT1 protein